MNNVSPDDELKRLRMDLAFAERELALVSVSRRRMMQRTALACFERDAAVACLIDNGIEPPVQIGGNLSVAQLDAISELLRKYGYAKRSE